MKRPSVCLLILSVIAIAAVGACGQSPSSAGCSTGHTPYSASDIVLQLTEPDREHSYRLPLGKVVTAGMGDCVSSNALEALGNQLPPSTPGRTYGAAFRAVKIGVADIYRVNVCGETCMESFRVKVTVTNGCEILPRSDVAKLFSTPNTSWISLTSTAKLIQARDYQRVIPIAAPLVDVPPEKPVWAVLASGRLNFGASGDPSPAPITWAATAVDPCTDHILFGWWEGTNQPSGWSALTDQSPN